MSASEDLSRPHRNALVNIDKGFIFRLTIVIGIKLVYFQQRWPRWRQCWFVSIQPSYPSLVNISSLSNFLQSSIILFFSLFLNLFITLLHFLFLLVFLFLLLFALLFFLLFGLGSVFDYLDRIVSFWKEVSSSQFVHSVQRCYERLEVDVGFLTLFSLVFFFLLFLFVMISDVLGIVYVENVSVIDAQERLISLVNHLDFFLSVLKILNVYLWKFLQRQNSTILLKQSFDPFFLSSSLLFPTFLLSPFLFLFLLLQFELFLYFLADLLFYFFEADTSLLKDIFQTCHLRILQLFCFFFKLLLYSVGDCRDKSFYVFCEGFFHLEILLFYLFRDLIVVLYQDQAI